MMKEGWARTDRSIYWREDGERGRPIVMLHEMGGSTRSFDAVASALLDQDRRIVRIDQRGFGASEKPRSSYAFEDLAGDVAAVLDAASIDEPVDLIAVASGCAIAVDFAARWPARASRLLLCSPALELSEQMRQETRKRAEAMMSAEMANITDGALSVMYPEPIRNADFDINRNRFLANDPVGFALATRAFAESSVDVTRISHPCLLLAGGCDIRPVDQVRAVAARIPDARVEVVAAAGHMMAVQAPGDVARHACAFFTETTCASQGA